MAMSPPPIASFKLYRIFALPVVERKVVEHAARGRGRGCSCLRRGCGSEIEALRDTRRRPERWSECCAVVMGNAGLPADEGVECCGFRSFGFGRETESVRRGEACVCLDMRRPLPVCLILKSPTRPSFIQPGSLCM